MIQKLAIIPARGGSKRIPRKNIKPFLGQPIMAYSIQMALESGLFDEVMVSTNDPEIAETAVKFGAKVPFFRSEEASSDTATTFMAVRDVIEKYRINGISLDNCDIISVIYPTAPFVNAAILKQSFQVLGSGQFDSVFPVIKFGFPPQRGLVFSDNKIQWKWPENALRRSQDLEPIYHDAGQFYTCNLAKCLKEGSILTNNSMGIEISELAAQDIDSETDWKLAELKYKMLHENL